MSEPKAKVIIDTLEFSWHEALLKHIAHEHKQCERELSKHEWTNAMLDYDQSDAHGDYLRKKINMLADFRSWIDGTQKKEAFLATAKELVETVSAEFDVPRKELVAVVRKHKWLKIEFLEEKLKKRAVEYQYENYKHYAQLSEYDTAP